MYPSIHREDLVAGGWDVEATQAREDAERRRIIELGRRNPPPAPEGDNPRKPRKAFIRKGRKKKSQENYV